jgi:cytochrome bd-type quinol oxidase subunit 2
VFESINTIQKQKGLSHSAAFSFMILIVACSYSVYFEASEYARESQMVKLILVNVIAFFVPLSIFIGIAWVSKNTEPFMSRIISFASALLNTAFFPFWALVTGCYLQLDCI